MTKKKEGRKKTMGRKKSGGRRSTMTREEEVLYRSGGVLSPKGSSPPKRRDTLPTKIKTSTGMDAMIRSGAMPAVEASQLAGQIRDKEGFASMIPLANGKYAVYGKVRTPAEWEADVRASVKDWTDELAVLGGGMDSDTIEEINSDMASGRYKEAARAMTGLAESFGDNVIIKYNDIVHGQIFDYVGRTTWTSKLEAGYQEDRQASLMAGRIDRRLSGGFPQPLTGKGIDKAVNDAVRKELGSMKMAIGFDRQTLARVAAELDDPKMKPYHSSAADYIKSVELGITIDHERFMAK
jgi:hypothetical protein